MNSSLAASRMALGMLALTFGASPVSAMADPKVLPGLWAFVTQPPVPPLAKYQMCIAGKTQPVGGPPHLANCQDSEVLGQHGEQITETVCHVGHLTTMTKSIRTYSSTSHFHLRTERTTTSDLPDGVSGRLHTNEVDATFVGPCPEAMRAGQMKLMDGTIVAPSKVLQLDGSRPPPRL